MKHEVNTPTDMRIDSYLAAAYPEYSRSFIKNLILKNLIVVNEKPAKADTRLKVGDVIRMEIPEAQELEIVAQDIPIEIIYQDKDIAVINKPQGMVTHPAVGNYDGTLVNAILFHIKDLSGINGEIRPGIVHRLDKDTSGLLVIAKNDAAHKNLSEQIAQKRANRVYRAIVFGNVQKDEGTISTFIDRDPRDRKKMAVTRTGRVCITHYRVLKRYLSYTYVECTLETGRTHQIRVHMKYLGYPVVGDKLYTKKKDRFGLKGQLLHAYKLGLYHPVTNEYMEFFAPLPEHFQKVLDYLEKNY